MMDVIITSFTLGVWTRGAVRSGRRSSRWHVVRIRIVHPFTMLLIHSVLVVTLDLLVTLLLVLLMILLILTILRSPLHVLLVLKMLMMLKMIRMLVGMLMGIVVAGVIVLVLLDLLVVGHDGLVGVNLVVEVGVALRVRAIGGTVIRHGTGWDSNLRYVKVILLEARSVYVLRRHFLFDGVRCLSSMEVGLGDHDDTIEDKLSWLLGDDRTVSL